MMIGLTANAADTSAELQMQLARALANLASDGIRLVMSSYLPENEIIPPKLSCTGTNDRPRRSEQALDRLFDRLSGSLSLVHACQWARFRCCSVRPRESGSRRSSVRYQSL